MSGKVLITSGPFVRAASGQDDSLREASQILKDAGLEIVAINKGDNEYRVEDFKDIMPGVGAVIAGGEPWNEEWFKISPDLKLIARFGVGYDAVDIAKAKEYGILVTNTRVHELSNGVAELALGLTLAVYRKIAWCCSDMKRGVWQNRSGLQIQGKTVGIVGFGAIGKCFASLVQGFGVRLLVNDPFADQNAAKKMNAEIVPFDQLLAESDIVSLSAPNTPENRKMFNPSAFAKMKDGAVFVNTARGAMVDEAALYEALTSGKLLGAGLDVWETEPTPSDNPLLGLDNVVCLPHIAGETKESTLAMAKCTARQVVAVFSGQTPDFILNP